MRVARADLIVGLVQAAREQDELGVRRTVEALVAEQRGKRHNALADRLEAALRTNGSAAVERAPAPAVEHVEVRARLEDLVLPDAVAVACAEIVDEHRRAGLLHEHGLVPRHRLLLTGPPGNGKACVAEGLAAALGLPLFHLRVETATGATPADTAGRLATVFEFVGLRSCVLLMRDLDTAAAYPPVLAGRLIDQVPERVLLVATSSRREQLDRALLPHFQAQLCLPSPDLAQRTAFFDRFVAGLDGATYQLARRMADGTEGASFAALHELTLDVRRRVLLDSDRELRRIVAERLRRLAGDTG